MNSVNVCATIEAKAERAAIPLKDLSADAWLRAYQNLSSKQSYAIVLARLIDMAREIERTER